MNPEYLEHIKKDAQDAAEMNRTDPGSGYAYAMGVVKAIAESKFTRNAEKVEQIRIFLQEFNQSKGKEKYKR